MTIATIGIDLGKSVFHLVALDAGGHLVERKRLSRTQLVRFVANTTKCLVGMEACCGSHHLGRVLAEHGHDVRLIPAQFVKPFVKSNKNDYVDAEAIAEAVQRPRMRFVPIKTIDQLDLQALHRVRDRLVSRRTGVINQIRAFLLERGITPRTGRLYLRRQMPWMLGEDGAGLSERLRRILHDLWRERQQLEDEITKITAEIEQIAKSDDACGRLMSVPGVGPIVATALIAAIGDGTGFRRGRDLAAWLGLVPRQHSTGGKPKLLGVSKRGNPYVRRLFIQGAHAVLVRKRRETRSIDLWTDRLATRAHRNVVAVALANKLARIAWAVLAKRGLYAEQIAATPAA
jgi:transposase